MLEFPLAQVARQAPAVQAVQASSNPFPAVQADQGRLNPCQVAQVALAVQAQWNPCQEFPAAPVQ